MKVAECLVGVWGVGSGPSGVVICSAEVNGGPEGKIARRVSDQGLGSRVEDLLFFLYSLRFRAV